MYIDALMTTGNIIEDRVDNNFTTLDCRCYPNCNYIRYSTAVYSDNTGAIKYVMQTRCFT